MEQIVEILLPQINKTIVVVVQSVPQERVQNRTDILVSPIMEKIIEVPPPLPQEHIQERVAERILKVPVLLIMEANEEVVQRMPSAAHHGGYR